MSGDTTVHAVDQRFQVKLTNGDTRTITADYYKERDGYVFFLNGEEGNAALVDGIAKRRIVSIETGAGSDE